MFVFFKLFVFVKNCRIAQLQFSTYFFEICQCHLTVSLLLVVIPEDLVYLLQFLFCYHGPYLSVRFSHP